MGDIFNKRIISHIFVGVGSFAIGMFGSYLFFSSVPENEGEDDNWLYLIEEEGDEQNEELAEDNVIVDVKGAVKRPGLYELKEGERVYDAIQAAGGLTDNANKDVLNLAQKCFDEMVIYVPTIEEYEENEGLTTIPIMSMYDSNDGKINVNTANLDELTRLPGIGPAKGEAIIQYREENGPFQSVDELLNVPGIGEKTLNTMKEQIVVR